MRVLDLYCCGGGASYGIVQSGADVVGVDLDWRMGRHYLFPFVCADALTLDPGWIARHFDWVWASPPCQRYSVASVQDGYGQAAPGAAEEHPDLINVTRQLLLASGIPFVLENVVGAPLRRDLMLCGKMFGLNLARHRIFEIHGATVPQPTHVWPHEGRIITVAGNPGGSSVRDGGARFGSVADWQEAMGIDWLPARLIKEAIPPAYSRWIAQHVAT